MVLWSQSLNGFNHISQTELFLKLEDVFSDAELINCGAQEESISGPLLFLIYINDLPQPLNETGSYLYVDHTCII